MPPRSPLLKVISRALSVAAFLAALQGPVHAQLLPLMDPALQAATERGGPAVLRPATSNPATGDTSRTTNSADTRQAEDRLPMAPVVAQSQSAPRSEPSEFERYVRRLANQDVRRLGSEIVISSGDNRSADWSSSVPPEYEVGVGDEVLVLLWGSVDADLRLMVDRDGRISLPRVGAVQVAGLRADQLQGAIERRVGQVYKNYQLSVTLGRLRGIRVLVMGSVVRPGTYTVNALSTVVGALLLAGGPSAHGSFRNITHRRGATVLGTLDLYDLLLQGDRTADRFLKAGDVVHVATVGTQVGVIGSVNNPSIVELKSTEGISDALRLAGGFAALADRTRVTVERLKERTEQRVTELRLPQDAKQPLSYGDVIRAFNSTDTVLSTARQNKRVRVDGEVRFPGEYVLPPESTLQDALQAAGGLTAGAFVYGAQFTRVSVRTTQQENYERALRDLETDFARAAGSQRLSSPEQAVAYEAQSTATARLVERLRTLRPNGRIVLQTAPGSKELPQLALEDGDRLYIPPQPTTVGVFGSVFNAGTYLFSAGRPIEDYLRLAGGPTKGADESSIFIVRANGQVISSRQTVSKAWFSSSGDQLSATRAEPGDTVFVPEELDKTTFLQAAKDWTQVLYQFGIGVAGIMSAIR